MSRRVIDRRGQLRLHSGLVKQALPKPKVYVADMEIRLGLRTRLKLPYLPYCVYLVILGLWGVHVEGCLLRITGQVSAENYTYYSLSQKGTFVLHLRSLQGDADLYVSEGHTYPTFDSDDHQLSSTTCGDDRVDIPAAFKRPVGIGVYGAFGYDISTYELCFAEGGTESQFYPMDSASEELYEEDSGMPSMSQSDEESGSFLWTLFLDFMRIFIELIL